MADKDSFSFEIKTSVGVISESSKGSPEFTKFWRENGNEDDRRTTGSFEKQKAAGELPQ